MQRKDLRKRENGKGGKKIVEEAENPNSKEFKDAVEEHRNAKNLEEAYKELVQRVRVAVEE